MAFNKPTPKKHTRNKSTHDAWSRNREEQQKERTRLAQKEAREAMTSSRIIPEKFLAMVSRTLPGLGNCIDIPTARGNIKTTPINELRTKPVVAINTVVLERIMMEAGGILYDAPEYRAIEPLRELIGGELQRRSQNRQ